MGAEWWGTCYRQPGQTGKRLRGSRGASLSDEERPELEAGFLGSILSLFILLQADENLN
jgi:hypothetical protein